MREEKLSSLSILYSSYLHKAPARGKFLGSSKLTGTSSKRSQQQEIVGNLTFQAEVSFGFSLMGARLSKQGTSLHIFQYF